MNSRVKVLRELVVAGLYPVEPLRVAEAILIRVRAQRTVRLVEFRDDCNAAVPSFDVDCGPLGEFGVPVD